ncbi:hypothetical protein AB0O31_16940 [Kitasatospora cineracea]|uniref:hypothetical protein n=1 Tax=Kitasatospora cineracea TaxID=88074 RepID=UPI00343595DF
MPGQHRRKRNQEAARRRQAARYEGWQWHPLYSTQDYAEFTARLRRLRAERTYNEERLRLDTFCGRLTHPSTYRISVLMPPDAQPPPPPPPDAQPPLPLPLPSPETP